MIIGGRQRRAETDEDGHCCRDENYFNGFDEVKIGSPDHDDVDDDDDDETKPEPVPLASAAGLALHQTEIDNCQSSSSPLLL